MLARVTSPAVIVASHNQAAALGRLLESLERQTVEHDVIVVDNASTDGTGELLATRFPAAKVIRLSENVGFCRAVNRSVESCAAATLVLVNDDAVCEPRFVEALVRALAPRDGVVMAAGVLLQREAPDRIDSAGIVFDRTLLAFDYLHGEPAAALDGAADPLGPTGGAAAFDRAAFDNVGGFDDRFFAYLEDVDLVARLLCTGADCRLAPGARAVHAHSATIGSGSRRKNELMGWGRGYMIGRYRLHHRPALLARAFAGELAIASGQLLVDRTTVGFGARVRGFLEGARAPARPIPPAARYVTLSYALRQRLRRVPSRGAQRRS